MATRRRSVHGEGARPRRDDTVARVLGDAGFDLVHELDLGCLAEEPGTEVIRATGLRRGVLVANTRALWPIFVATAPVGDDPLDRYTEQTVTAAFAGAQVWFAHQAPYLPFQRIAVAAGLAALAPTHLAIHPIFGPWFGLRALVALPGDPLAAPPRLPPYRCTGECIAAFARTTDDWRSWLAVRDACCIGREHRYSDAQLAYHYTKDPAHLLW
jgi:hypothetical protein